MKEKEPMFRRSVFETTICFAGTLAFAGLLSAAPTSWSFESVATHPRWIDFARRVKTDYLFDLPEELLQQSCRKALEIGNDTQKKEGDPVSACIKGALESVVVAEYVDPKAYAERQAAAKHNYGSIGLELSRKERDSPLQVVQPLAGTPAERAGILPGDLILELDGMDISPLSIEETISRIRGEVGKILQISIQRTGKREPIQLGVLREKIRLPTARVKLLPSRVVYARVTRFSSDTGQLLRDKLGALGVSPDQPPVGLILDLRNNDGGSINALVAVASMLAPPGKPIVAMEGRHKTTVMETLVDTAHPSQPRLGNGASAAPWLQNGLLVVLVNEQTAGAAEALAQFLRETRSAKMLGQRTAGALALNEFWTIGDDAAISLTTATMASPMGKRWTDGLIPDTFLNTPVDLYEDGGEKDPWVQNAAAMLLATSPTR